MYLNNNIFYKHFEFIDFLKGIAIIMIILVHYTVSFSLPFPLKDILSFLQMGCQIFFIVSAFTICGSYSLKKPSYFQFIKHRFSVLAKGWYLAIFLNLFVNLILQMLFSYSTLHNSNFMEIILNLFFLNGLVPGPTNNQVVRGGWFVGTISIFYFLFPLIYKVYMNNNALWKKYRYIIFPIISLLFSSIFLNVANIISPRFACKNNSFIYFSFLCQWPCLTLGFSLFDIISAKKENIIRFPIVKFFIYLIISIILFFSNIPQIFTVIPFVYSLSVFYLFIYLYRKNSLKHYNKLIVKYGKVNFGIYLTHPFITYEFVILCKLFIRKIIPIFSQEVIFVILCPLVLILSYFCGKYFMKIGIVIWNFIFANRLPNNKSKI